MRQPHLDNFLLASANRAANSLYPFISWITMTEPCVIAIWGGGGGFVFDTGSYYVVLAAGKSLCQMIAFKVVDQRTGFLHF